MTAIAVFQMACLQVIRSDKQRDKHVRVVLIGQSLVHLTHDTIWFIHMSRDDTEQTTRHCHHQGGRDALARHVADTEEEPIVTDIEIIEITSNGLGWCQTAIDINVLTLRIRWEDLRKHRHLNVAGHLQLTLDTSFLLVDALQLLHLFCE